MADRSPAGLVVMPRDARVPVAVDAPQPVAAVGLLVVRDDASPLQLLEAEEIARTLGLSKWSIYRWGKEGRIPSVRLGRKVRYELDRVLDALRSSPPEPVAVSRGMSTHPRSVRRRTPARAASSAPATASKPMSHEERMRAAIEATRALSK